MIAKRDIYRAANMLVERYGAEALTEAAKMIDKMLDQGDLGGRDVWRRIRQAISELQAPPSGPLQ